MAWCRQATSVYLIQVWPISMSSYGVTMSQWINPVGTKSQFVTIRTGLGINGCTNVFNASRTTINKHNALKHINLTTTYFATYFRTSSEINWSYNIVYCRIWWAMRAIYCFKSNFNDWFTVYIDRYLFINGLLPGNYIDFPAPGCNKFWYMWTLFEFEDISPNSIQRERKIEGEREREGVRGWCGGVER